MLPVLLALLLSRGALVEAAALSTGTLDFQSSHSTSSLVDGTFTGLTNTTNGIIYYRGIRYADPPVGELRWRASVSISCKIWVAYSCISWDSPVSQPSRKVYIPIAIAAARSKLPVLVYFHGGGFETERTRDAPPENILLGSTEPLIFVTFEYRLGQFGFLAETLVHQSGKLNVGLLDQRAALEWVQIYISKFGGDPRRVTIWGQSAGAASTMFHLIAEGGKDKNLFHQVMGDSPPLIYLPHYTRQLYGKPRHAIRGGCGNSGNGSAIMACLRAAPTNTIATSGRNTLANLTSSLYPFGPIADGSFIRERPVEAFQNGNFIRVPVIFGSNTNEGANRSASFDNPDANTSFPDATETTVYNFLAGQYSTFTQTSFQTAIAEFYPLSDYGGSFSLQRQQMYGEMRYIRSAMMITGAAQAAGWEAYQYHWDNPTLGSDHADEFFNGDEVFDADDQALGIAMRRYWTSFATSGVPVAASAISWKASSDNAGGPRILLHPGDMVMEQMPEGLSARCAFWHGLTSELAT
ncbi:alpha/beta-hydrolase [Mycena latifolia]|nr:alpha/beta-hydrolase [Mycena latifolia]KAJ7494878.1 alpha/beta-hydrolase [Mycena latifolia]